MKELDAELSASCIVTQFGVSITLISGLPIYIHIYWFLRMPSLRCWQWRLLLTLNLLPMETPPMLSLTLPTTFKSDFSLPDPPICTLFNTLLRIDVIDSSQEFTDYPIKPFLHDFLQNLKNVNNKNTIIPMISTLPLDVSWWTATSLPAKN